MGENLKEKGFTLVEVLVSIILLFIILTSFLSLFFQSAMFIHSNEEKLGTMQMAQKYINLIEENVGLSDLNSIQIGTEIDKKAIDQLILKNTNKSIDSSSFRIKGFITNTDTPKGLTQFKIIVQDPNDTKNKSVTYTYIRK
ncbi:type IV pilus modification PilV family protein [Neobacillus terrae]|uniref:type IV pilus modification PilV family protein n=1 Tax=Neobacillus terrae TaxID=3034837 RepID=UPI00140DA281|nr:type II secretion system protein [Neobacillus terrae]NHM30486.1 type II secretion system protein [Neobacillus terrae]